MENEINRLYHKVIQINVFVLGEGLCDGKEECATTELGCPPAGRQTPSMGTLAGELCQRAADAEVICSVATAAHVLFTGLGVRGWVHQRRTQPPGFRVDHLVADWALKGVNGKKNDYEASLPGP